MRNACPARFLVLRVLLFSTLAPEISCLGARPNHEQKCFWEGEFAHIRPAFHDHDLRQRDAKPVHYARIDAGETFEVLAEFFQVGRGILAMGVTFAGRRRRYGGGRPMGAGLAIGAFDFGIAFCDLLTVEVEHRQRLLQDEEMLCPPGTGERLRDFFDALFAVWVAIGSQSLGIALPSNDGANDRLPGDAGDIAEGLRELHVHLQQGLLHVQDVRGAMLDELGAMPQQGAEGNEFCFGAKGACQQPVLMESLNPLGIADVAFFARYAAQGAGADEQAGEALRFEQLEQRNPVDAGGFHSDGGDALRTEPVGNGKQVDGVDAEGAQQLGTRRLRGGGIARYAGNDLRGADVDTGGVRVDRLQPGEGVGCFQPRGSLASFAHGYTPVG